MSNTCCTWMFVRTHWWSVWEYMTPEQYNSFIESMNHPIPRYFWLIILGVVVLLILLMKYENKRIEQALWTDLKECIEKED